MKEAVSFPDITMCFFQSESLVRLNLMSNHKNLYLYAPGQKNSDVDVECLLTPYLVYF